MFGWLAHALGSLRPSREAANWSISRCLASIDGPELAARLPMLGSVLYLPARCAAEEPWPLPAGWLVARCELAPLLRTERLIVSSMIGADGPREWIDCVDGQGRFCARVHLLPDTDYLAWDALLAGGETLPATPLCPDQMACRAASAELACFRTRRLGRLDLLETVPLDRLSMLGRHIAREAARTAAVELEYAQG
jgi:hypothetical protein